MALPELLRLEALLSVGRPAGQVVAYRRGAPQTWAALLDQAEGWTQALREARAARVALFLKDTWDFTAALLGAWRAGVAIFLPGDTLPDTLSELRSQVDAFAGDVPEGPGRRVHPSPKTREAPALRFEAPPLSLTLFTSGSTGRQQPFEKRLGQLCAEVACLERTFGPSVGAAVVLSTVSHQHIYGLLFKVLWPLCAGRPFVSEALFFPEELLAAARAFERVALVASPAHLKRLPDFLDWSPLRARVGAIFSSGGPLSWEAAAQTEARLGHAPREVYGSTETGGIAWRARTAEHAPWQPFDDVALEVDATTQRLRVRSPKLPDGEWFQTQDRVELASDGTLSLLGRQDRVVKVEEKRVSLDAVERALREEDDVTDARVVVLPEDGGRLGAVVQLREDAAAVPPGARATRLRQTLAQKLEPLAVPRRFRFVEALPFDARGKTTEAALLGLFAPAPAAPSTHAPELLAATAPEPGKLSLSLRLTETLRAFEGHFPKAQVLPGVVQVDWAQRFGRERLGVRGEFRGMESLKFQRVLQPGDAVELRLEYAPERGRLKFLYQSARGLHASGVLLFH